MTQISNDLTQAENSPGAVGHRWSVLHVSFSMWPKKEDCHITVIWDFSSVNKFPKVQNQRFPGFLKAQIQIQQSYCLVGQVFRVSPSSRDFTRMWVWLFSLKSLANISTPQVRDQKRLPTPPSCVM